MEQCRPYNKEKLNEQLIYLDKRTVTKVAPAESSQGYLNQVVRPKKELYVPARKAVKRLVRPLKPEMSALIDCFNKKQRSHLIHFRIRQN